jgi:hypothetical protein
MWTRYAGVAGAIFVVASLAGCGNSGGDTSAIGSGSTPTNVITPGAPTATCSTPLPAEAISTGMSVTDQLPSDFDATANPTPTPTTTINFTLMLPKRCAGDRFPLILQSHGYGGSRLTAIAADGTLDPTVAHFTSIDNLVMALPYYGYVVISYDERGHGTPLPGTAAHNARIIDPAAETQDASAILDWVYDHPDVSFVQQQTDTGISKDLVVGTIGYSYGGGFEFPLEQLDPRVDTMVPNGTWNNLLYSLLPNDGVKLGFDSLLCLLASPTPDVGGNVNNTPLIAALCNIVGPQGASAVSIRTRTDLANAITAPTAVPRAARDETEVLDFFYSHGNQYFETQTRDGATIESADVPGYMSPALMALPGFAGATFRPAPVIPAAPRKKPITALLLQGNRDTLFNVAESYFNYEYLRKTVLKEGAPDSSSIHLLTTEGGHMNPLALQTQGTANCGGVVGLNSILAWFNHELKGTASADYNSIPQLCISVTPTPAANTAPTNDQLTGLLLADGNMPVGDQGGKSGGISVKQAVVTATVVATGTAITSTGTSMPVFVPVGKPISGLTPVAGGGGKTVAVLAGLPTAQLVSVTSPLSAAMVPVAYVGVGIQRGSTTILVDDQVTPFAALTPAAGTVDCPASVLVPTANYSGTTSVTPLATDHCHNRSTNDYPASNSLPGILFPGIGEPLQNGDQLGLLFYENQVQYLPANSGGVATGVPNPYSVTVYNVQIPVLIPGPGANAYPGSTLSGAAALP